MHGSQRSPRRGQPDQRQTASRGPSNRLVSGRFGVVPASTLIGGPPDEAVRPGTTATLARPTYEVGASIVGCPPGMCLLIGAVVGEKAQGPVDEVVATSLQAMPQVVQEVAQLSQALRGVRRASDQISSTASLQRLIALEGFPLWSPGSCKPSVCGGCSGCYSCQLHHHLTFAENSARKHADDA